MKNFSIWLDEIEDANLSPLEANIEVDVLIIGGGITGISTAYHLSNSDLKVCVVEKNKLYHGITSKTTGKLIYLQDNIYSKIKFYRGIKTAKEYLKSQKEAIYIVTNIIKKEHINCNLEKVNSYVFDENRKDKIEKEIQLLNQLDEKVIKVNSLPNKKKICSGFYGTNTYVFHPLKYLSKLKDICLERNVKIYENTKVISIKHLNNYYVVNANSNYIKAKYVVLAVHYPYFLMPFFLPFKTYMEKSYIKAYKVNKHYKYSAISISRPIKSLRYYSNDKDFYKLYLTNSHNIAVRNNDIKNFKSLINDKVDYIWSNNDIMTLDLIPYIGEIDTNLYIGTGYNTWGMTNGSLAGKIISDLILKGESSYKSLFDPKRALNTGKIINYPVVIGSNAYSFIKSKLSKNKYWYSNNVIFETRNGKSIGIYVDELGNKHMVYSTCPHLKCSLQFNEVEKTWDCPCHASRFDIDGNCIDGPSNYNITYKKAD